MSGWAEAVASFAHACPVEDGLAAARTPLRLVGPDDLSPRVLARYQADPIAWAVERLAIPEHTLRWSLNPGYQTHRWDGTPDPLVAIADALVQSSSVAVESGTGTGKTFYGAMLVLWWIDVFRPVTPDGPGGLVVTVAPKEKQLTLHIWKEIGRLWPRFHRLHPDAELTQLMIRMRPNREDWGAVGFVAGVGATEESSTKAQGFHAEHMLIVLEETPGIHPAVLTALEATCTAPHNLRLGFGNPDHALDQLHLMASSPGVVAVRISGYDHPNVVTGDPTVVPGAVSRQKLDERLAKYGEGHRLVLSRSRGISPTEASDALFRMAHLREAVLRRETDGAALRAAGLPALGVDVANSEAGDLAAICEGDGAYCVGVTAYRCPDANQFARLQVAPKVSTRLPARQIGVDSVGVGAGAVNEMARLKKPVTSLNGAAKPRYDKDHEETFNNLRSQMWWTAARELDEVGIPEDEELFADLLAPRYEVRGGKIVVESKEHLSKRLPGGRSPNKGDAYVYWNWMRKPRAHPAGQRAPLSRSYFTA